MDKEIKQLVKEIEEIRRMRDSYGFTNVLTNPLRLLFKVDVWKIPESQVNELINKLTKNFIPTI